MCLLVHVLRGVGCRGRLVFGFVCVCVCVCVHACVCVRIHV